MQLPYLEADQPFPEGIERSAGHPGHPGLLAAGGDLSVTRLQAAYARGMFPWFSEDEPILWWSTDPRMVLQTRYFKLHRSLAQAIKAFLRDPLFRITTNTAFAQVIAACSESRDGQAGTWILPEMQRAYMALHQAGSAHSVEVWRGSALIGGLYGINIGRMFYGESMFSRESNASKCALTALVFACRARAIAWIDCQQNTPHLASLGAYAVPRSEFFDHITPACALSAPADWAYDENQLFRDLNPGSN